MDVLRPCRLALLLSACLLPTACMARTCIVGAGPSGLSLAWWLTQDGQDVVVFEKEGRIGGKVMSWTDTTTGHVHDVGANGVYAGYNLTHQFIARYGLSLEPAYLFKHGLDATSSLLRRAIHDPISLVELLTSSASRSASHHDRGMQWMQRYDQGYEGSPPYATAELARYVEPSAGIFPLMGRQIVGGMKGLFDHVAADLPAGVVRLNHTARELTHSSAGPRLDGHQCERIVVTAVPTTVPRTWLPAELRLLQVTAYFSSIVRCDGSMLRWRPGRHDALIQRQHADNYTTVFGYHDVSNGDDEAATRAQMVASLRADGCAPATVHFWRLWRDYFPRFLQSDVDSGILRRIEALQGTDGVYWAGTYMHFDVVEGALEYSKHLFDTYLSKAAGKAKRRRAGDDAIAKEGANRRSVDAPHRGTVQGSLEAGSPP